MWLSVPPETSRNPSAASAAPSAAALATTAAAYVPEFGTGGLGEGHRLGRNDVLEGPTLETGEDGAVDLLGQLGPAQDGATPGPAQRLVGGERHHVGHPDRAGMDTAGDEAGRVRGVEHEEGAHGVGDLPERHRIDRPGVRGRAGHNQRGLLALGQVRHLVEVDDLARLAVVVAGPGSPRRRRSATPWR